MDGETLKNRKSAAQLLRQVRLGYMSVRSAMINYPKNDDDESLTAAYHALIHYEADEDLRAKDPLYKEEQDDYIEYLASTLDKGDDLPENIIDNYKQFYDYTPNIQQKGVKGFFKSFWKSLNI